MSQEERRSPGAGLLVHGTWFMTVEAGGRPCTRGDHLANATKTISYSCGKNEIGFLSQAINKTQLWKTKRGITFTTSPRREACGSKTQTRRAPKSSFINAAALTRRPCSSGPEAMKASSGVGGVLPGTHQQRGSIRA